MAKILIIDDETTIIENLTFILELEDHVVLSASSGQEGIAIFDRESDIAVVITDMRMPGMTGMEVLRAIRSCNEDVGIIILTGHGDMDNAVTAMKEGAFDYLNKPVNADKLLITLENAVKRYNLLNENRKLQQDILKKNAYLQGLHDSAQQILMNLVPGDPPPCFPGIKTAAVYKSCDQVGGDMYDIFQWKEHVFFYIFDVTSHGIQAAVITMIIKSYFENMKHLIFYMPDTPDLVDMIDKLNIEMLHNTPSDMYATLAAGYWNKTKQTITYISAGHIDQYLLHEGTLVPLRSTGTMVGLFDFASFETTTYPVTPGDKLLLFTDGLTEVWENGRIVGADHISNLVSHYAQDPIQDLLQHLYHDILNLADGKSLDDDLTAVGLEFLV